jgi:hypothetical protein
MINLKLAEYNKDGKFQGFLELGKDFLFGGESVVFHNPSNQSKYKYIDTKGVAHINYKLDYKDPLNRFNGLFDGRTYGEGKFVLIKDDEDDIIQMGEHFYRRQFDDSDDKLYYLGAYILGNLHQNPELYEKLK